MDLHNLVRYAAEVVGAQAGEEVCCGRGQEEAQPILEPAGDGILTQ